MMKSPYKTRGRKFSGGGQPNGHGGGGHRQGGSNQGGGGGSGFNMKHAQQVRARAMKEKERYGNMARDAAASGDRVLAERCLQHVEHYQRVLNELQAQVQPRDNQQESQQQGQDDNQQAADASEDSGSRGNGAPRQQERQERQERRPQADGYGHAREEEVSHQELPAFLKPDTAESAPGKAADTETTPKRRGRPRKDASADDGKVAKMPAAILGEEIDEDKPKRRIVRRVATEG